MTRYGLTMEDARENAERAEKEQAAREADHPRRAKECKERMIKYLETEHKQFLKGEFHLVFEALAWEITR